MDDSDEKFEDNDDEVDKEPLELMKDHDLDVDDAKKVQEIMDGLGLDEADALELKDDL